MKFIFTHSELHSKQWSMKKGTANVVHWQHYDEPCSILFFCQFRYWRRKEGETSPLSPLLPVSTIWWEWIYSRVALCRLCASSGKGMEGREENKKESVVVWHPPKSASVSVSRVTWKAEQSTNFTLSHTRGPEQKAWDTETDTVNTVIKGNMTAVMTNLWLSS